ncbi:hypothetical protein HDV00_009115 [Rhizophlyctis rosea]|nr:hypothetical protein HDV00_009115 [Rhizophlyctis rosea]
MEVVRYHRRNTGNLPLKSLPQPTTTTTTTIPAPALESQSPQIPPQSDPNIANTDGRAYYRNANGSPASLPIVGVCAGLFLLGAVWYYFSYKKSQARFKDPNYLPSYFESTELRILSSSSPSSSSSSSRHPSSRTIPRYPPPDYNVTSSRDGANHIPAWMWAQMGVRVRRDEMSGDVTLVTVEDSEGVLEIGVVREGGGALSSNGDDSVVVLGSSTQSREDLLSRCRSLSNVSGAGDVEGTSVSVTRVLDTPKIILTRGESDSSNATGEGGSNRESWGPPPSYQ